MRKTLSALDKRVLDIANRYVMTLVIQRDAKKTGYEKFLVDYKTYHEAEKRQFATYARKAS